jgi:hypothetical protein
MPWEYTSVECDPWLPVNAQGGPKELLKRLGDEGWSAYAVTPPIPPPGDGDDPDQSSSEILLKRRTRR